MRARIAYAHRISFDWQVEIGSVATGTVTVIDDPPRDSWHPTWSPSGAELAYVGDHDWWIRLWIYDLETGVAQPVGADETDHLLPQWSPESSIL